MADKPGHSRTKKSPQKKLRKRSVPDESCVDDAPVQAKVSKPSISDPDVSTQANTLEDNLEISAPITRSRSASLEQTIVHRQPVIRETVSAQEVVNSECTLRQRPLRRRSPDSPSPIAHAPVQQEKAQIHAQPLRRSSTATGSLQSFGRQEKYHRVISRTHSDEYIRRFPQLKSGGSCKLHRSPLGELFGSTEILRRRGLESSDSAIIREEEDSAPAPRELTNKERAQIPVSELAIYFDPPPIPDYLEMLHYPRVGYPCLLRPEIRTLRDYSASNWLTIALILLLVLIFCVIPFVDVGAVGIWILNLFTTEDPDDIIGEDFPSREENENIL